MAAERPDGASEDSSAGTASESPEVASAEVASSDSSAGMATESTEASSADSSGDSSGDTASEPPQTQHAEPPAPPPELMPGGPQAWRRDDGASLAQVDPYLGGHWSVPWSDLMMVMFVLFAVLVSVQMRENLELVESAEHEEPVPVSVPEPKPTADLPPTLESAPEPQPEPEPAPGPEPDPEPAPVPLAVPSFEPLLRVNVFERSQDAVREARVENVEIVLLSDQSVKVSVQGPMFFELGEAALRPEVRTFLDRLARVIGQTAFAVRVIGHTDDYPVDTEAFPSNWELSAARAARVARYLIDSADIDPRRFTVVGRGEHEPAVPNINDANRALNRRVEIIITRDEVEPAGETLDQALDRPVDASVGQTEGRPSADADRATRTVEWGEPPQGDQALPSEEASSDGILVLDLSDLEAMERSSGDLPGQSSADGMPAAVMELSAARVEGSDNEAFGTEAAATETPLSEVPDQAALGGATSIRGLSRGQAPTAQGSSSVRPEADRLGDDIDGELLSPAMRIPAVVTEGALDRPASPLPRPERPTTEVLSGGRSRPELPILPTADGSSTESPSTVAPDPAASSTETQSAVAPNAAASSTETPSTIVPNAAASSAETSSTRPSSTRTSITDAPSGDRSRTDPSSTEASTTEPLSTETPR